MPRPQDASTVPLDELLAVVKAARALLARVDCFNGMGGNAIKRALSDERDTLRTALAELDKRND